MSVSGTEANQDSPAMQMDFSAIEELDPSLADGYRMIYCREVTTGDTADIFLQLI
jgi:hypothetical protein